MIRIPLLILLLVASTQTVFGNDWLQLTTIPLADEQEAVIEHDAIASLYRLRETKAGGRVLFSGALNNARSENELRVALRKVGVENTEALALKLGLIGSSSVSFLSARHLARALVVPESQDLAQAVMAVQKGMSELERPAADPCPGKVEPPIVRAAPPRLAHCNCTLSSFKVKEAGMSLSNDNLGLGLNFQAHQMAKQQPKVGDGFLPAEGNDSGYTHGTEAHIRLGNGQGELYFSGSSDLFTHDMPTRTAWKYTPSGWQNERRYADQYAQEQNTLRLGFQSKPDEIGTFWRTELGYQEDRYDKGVKAGAIEQQIFYHGLGGVVPDNLNTGQKTERGIFLVTGIGRDGEMINGSCAYTVEAGLQMDTRGKDHSSAYAKGALAYVTNSHERTVKAVGEVRTYANGEMDANVGMEVSKEFRFPFTEDTRGRLTLGVIRPILQSEARFEGTDNNAFENGAIPYEYGGGYGAGAPGSKKSLKYNNDADVIYTVRMDYLF